MCVTWLSISRRSLLGEAALADGEHLHLVRAQERPPPTPRPGTLLVARSSGSCGWAGSSARGSSPPPGWSARSPRAPLKTRSAPPAGAVLGLDLATSSGAATGLDAWSSLRAQVAPPRAPSGCRRSAAGSRSSGSRRASCPCAAPSPARHLAEVVEQARVADLLDLVLGEAHVLERAARSRRRCSARATVRMATRSEWPEVVGSRFSIAATAACTKESNRLWMSLDQLGVLEGHRGLAGQRGRRAPRPPR